jgi:hypothetical protein
VPVLEQGGMVAGTVSAPHAVCISGYLILSLRCRCTAAAQVCERTASDKKGGHLARRAADGKLVLRESAQCAKEDEAAFQDISTHRFFNTNNLWVRLDFLQVSSHTRPTSEIKHQPVTAPPCRQSTSGTRDACRRRAVCFGLACVRRWVRSNASRLV